MGDKEAQGPSGNDLFWRAFESSPLAMGITRASDGMYVAVNRAFELLSGFTRDELVGHTSAEVGIWLDVADRAELMNELLAKGSARGTGHPIRTKDGQIKRVDFALSLLDLEGEPHGFGVITGATEMRRERDLLERVVAYAPVIIFAMDAAGVITLAEGSALEKLGLVPGDLVGVSAFEVAPNDALMGARLREVLSGQPTHEIIRFRDRVFDVFASPIKGEEDDVLGVVGVATDVTDQVRSQEARARLWGHLVRAQEGERARIAAELHDGPIQQLAALQLRLAVLHDLLPDSPVPAQLEKSVEEGLAMMRRMVTELRPSTLDRLGLAAAVDADLRTMSAELGIGVEIEDADLLREPDPDTAITAYRILQEALANVRAHARASNVHVRLSTQEEGLLIRVKDDGVGFDPSPGEPGHIGLPSMREQAELAGGWMRVLSTPGSGTTVEVWLPSTTEPELA